MIDQDCLQLVSSEYLKLQGAIEDLGQSINKTLGRQKRDINFANKTEMRKLQVEIESLRKEKIRLEESIASNERANQLETERDWYKKEALQLDDELEKMKIKQKERAVKLDESEQDRSWLKGQVEKLTKQNRSLDQKFNELGVDLSSLRVEDEGPKAGVIWPIWAW